MGTSLDVNRRWTDIWIGTMRTYSHAEEKLRGESRRTPKRGKIPSPSLIPFSRRKRKKREMDKVGKMVQFGEKV